MQQLPARSTVRMGGAIHPTLTAPKQRAFTFPSSTDTPLISNILMTRSCLLWKTSLIPKMKMKRRCTMTQSLPARPRLCPPRRPYHPIASISLPRGRAPADSTVTRIVHHRALISGDYIASNRFLPVRSRATLPPRLRLRSPYLHPSPHLPSPLPRTTSSLQPPDRLLQHLHRPPRRQTQV